VQNNQVTLQDRITEALSAIIQFPLWGATRVMNMEMFDFGDRRTQLNRKGQEVDVGEYALHVQCPWRIVGPDGIIAASEDRKYPEEEMADWEEFDSDSPSRCEARMAAWLREHCLAPLKVDRVEADSVGGFRLLLQLGFALEAFPAHSLRGEYSEYWRLFRPSMETSHFVVTGHGVEDNRRQRDPSGETGMLQSEITHKPSE
jgi:hypothetical protein